ncbi:Phosphatidylinositol-4-phosphate 5-kinase [Entomophthora muscae]|uniref:Phosphatidylinositol-4-phosphate 5-kinase n=1 Tax=Entomophthora muscae TaxID=34485 RepID=A0ACC2TVX9_9FUNG|nr:Phosphatidylinositol-4-phosphate 5-kinase [Entomophthora muscae]
MGLEHKSPQHTHINILQVPDLKAQINGSPSSQSFNASPTFKSLNSVSDTESSYKPLLNSSLNSPSLKYFAPSKIKTEVSSPNADITKDIVASLEAQRLGEFGETGKTLVDLNAELLELNEGKPVGSCGECLPPIAEVSSHTDSAYSTISPGLCEESGSLTPQTRPLSKSNNISLTNSRVLSDDKPSKHRSLSLSSMPVTSKRRVRPGLDTRPLSFNPKFPLKGDFCLSPELMVTENDSDTQPASSSAQNTVPKTKKEEADEDIIYLSRRNTYAAPSSMNRPGSRGMPARRATKRMLARVKPKANVLAGSTPNSNPANYGTSVSEGHNNYALMYNMLTGIRVSVSRCTAKVKRPLTRQDFKSANKLAFDITGNELTPSSRYDFKFKDYSPWVFRSLRELFGIDPAEYLLSLTLKYILSELSTPGKSGSFFYYSQDFRFIIKTVHHSEHKFFRKILPGYYEHVKANPDTLISRIYGLHRVKMAHTRKIHFVVMANVFPPTKDIHSQFDLKGSTLGRYLDEAAASDAKLPPVLKDLNWLNQSRSLELGPTKRQLFFQQVRSDVDFLARHNIMDYSLLLGIHDMQRGNRDKLRQATLSVFDPMAAEQINLANQNYSPEQLRQGTSPDQMALAGVAPHRLPQAVGDERLQCVFYRDGGGFLATNENDEPSGELYCMGIIDIMTPYNLGKKFEHVFKSIGKDDNVISAVDPFTYAHRFLSFLTKSISHHEDLEPALSEYGASHPSRFHPKQE